VASSVNTPREVERIGRRDAIQEARHEDADRHAQDEAHCQADGRQLEALAQHRSNDLLRGRAERAAETELAQPRRPSNATTAYWPDRPRRAKTSLRKA
jgi:hypothetical protein